VILIFIIPFLTMRLIAEEKRPEDHRAAPTVAGDVE